VNQTGARNLPTPASSVQTPADCVALTEAFMYNPVTRTFATDQAMTTPIYPIVPLAANARPEDNVTSAVRQQHGGKHPVAFMDGHVERVRNEVLYINRTDAMLRRWNTDHQPHRDLADY
jgi:prepilin-type processing-associated H-X9-DG protein